MIHPAPVQASSAAHAPKKAAFLKRFTSRNRALKHALGVLSKDMQGSLGQLNHTIERISGSELNIEQLKKDLREQLSHLNEGMSLLGTMLETNSSEILKYVKKRKAPAAGKRP